ncbi:hypothetical protein SPRG_13150 [Saprolegnia parasitica CBS 223.65]|uniref:U6 snRNA-associated Sm-like protein LSm4 n=1 Tax=Saprolegnia parasitica (strain CBS 223.65) TaxID=695850 RepID=A0A067BTB7_SAPPC|nr:hypothetical protein SPRG_13150 [Saprolegnia parasitica CBS 223.65]KDO21734.1 hypothetical protein SPRG_13150 [Saprolegnia parasitica CBS 223.65]|eukprot:XP_012207537.1 hypothetical protein SPRG_13150 [Saprolegnia parasitica CBS 223.65]
MLPLSLLQAAQGEEMLVELKNGDTYNGVLVNCDTWMNVNLKNIICTSKDGDRFWKLTECYIRGNTIKYIGIPDKVLDQVNEEDLSKRGTTSFTAMRSVVAVVAVVAAWAAVVKAVVAVAVMAVAVAEPAVVTVAEGAVATEVVVAVARTEAVGASMPNSNTSER